MAGGGTEERNPQPAPPERPARQIQPERDPRRVVRESEWLDPGQSRNPNDLAHWGMP